MREAMAAADVGDDVYRDDPTVLALERRVADILGKDDAVFVPTGTMSNQVAVRAHCEPGDLLVIDRNGHIVLSEAGAAAALSGVTVKPLAGVRGIFGPDDVREAMGARHDFVPVHLSPPRTLLCVENTHNAGGGAVWSLDAVHKVCDTARSLGLALHLDGARLWHASAASGVPEREFAAPFDTVNVCFSKGLGAPVGSALAGSRRLIARARRFKQQFGGGMRQAGVLAAAALYAIEHHRGELAHDVRRARTLAEGIVGATGVTVDMEGVQSNIVRFELAHAPAGQFATECHAAGVYVLPVSPTTIRAVVHRDLGNEDIETASRVIARIARARAA